MEKCVPFFFLKGRVAIQLFLMYTWMVKCVPFFFLEGQIRSVPIVESANGTSKDRKYKWHSVFGLCTVPQMKLFLALRKQTRSHRQLVNGLIKLERNRWICDKADLLDAAFQSGDMHAMYSQLGALTKYAKSKSSAQKHLQSK